MNEQIFDWAENSKRILAGEGYSTFHSRFREQVALVRYLLDLGWEKEAIYEKWKDTSPKEILYADAEEERREVFGRVWRKAKKWINYTYQPVQIYQEEVDFINAMDVVPWIREYVLVLLVIYKYYGQAWCSYTNRIKCFCYAQTYVKTERPQYSLKLCDCIKSYAPYTTVIYDNSVAFKMNFVRNDGTPLTVIKNPSEALLLFGYLKNERVCTACGKVFSYKSARVKRTLCDDCYQRQRNKIKGKTRTRNRGPKKGVGDTKVQMID